MFSTHKRKKNEKKKLFRSLVIAFIILVQSPLKKKKKANPNSMKIQNYKHSSILNGCFQVQNSESQKIIICLPEKTIAGNAKFQCQQIFSSTDCIKPYQKYIYIYTYILLCSRSYSILHHNFLKQIITQYQLSMKMACTASSHCLEIMHGPIN